MRGDSRPSAAGNLRIDGLYFDQITTSAGTVLDSTSIKVGLSAQGYPFAAPSGIVDQTLRTPGDKAGASLRHQFRQLGHMGSRSSMGRSRSAKNSRSAYGLNGDPTSNFPTAPSNWNHTESLIARWRPAAGIEIMPFWSITNDYDDEAGTFYVCRLESSSRNCPSRGHNEGRDWADYRYTGLNTGRPCLGAHSRRTGCSPRRLPVVNDIKHDFTNILADEQPDGSGERLLFADPPRQFLVEQRRAAAHSQHPRRAAASRHSPQRSRARCSPRVRRIGFHRLRPGPRSARRSPDPEPAEFHFGEISHDRVKQTTFGIAYDGRWKNVGEISFGISKARLSQGYLIPGVPVAATRSRRCSTMATARRDFGSRLLSTPAMRADSRRAERRRPMPPTAISRCRRF